MTERHQPLSGNDRSAGARAFLEEVVALSKKYGFVLAHEDHEGAFVVFGRASLSKHTVERCDSAVLEAYEEQP